MALPLSSRRSPSTGLPSSSLSKILKPAAERAIPRARGNAVPLSTAGPTIGPVSLSARRLLQRDASPTPLGPSNSTTSMSPSKDQDEITTLREENRRLKEALKKEQTERQALQRNYERKARLLERTERLLLSARRENEGMRHSDPLKDDLLSFNFSAAVPAPVPSSISSISSSSTPIHPVSSSSSSSSTSTSVATSSARSRTRPRVVHSPPRSRASTTSTMPHSSSEEMDPDLQLALRLQQEEDDRGRSQPRSSSTSNPPVGSFVSPTMARITELFQETDRLQQHVEDLESLRLAFALQEEENRRQREDNMAFLAASAAQSSSFGLSSPSQSEGGVNPDNMTYEELLALEENMGSVSRGLTKQQIEALPSRMFRRGEDAVDCSVCQCELMEGDGVRTLPCSHIYHRGCIDRWLHVKKTCPLCLFCIETS
eukprot:GILK01006376.1.p1 GENE.GILK01006376.1~~GILK01006376.1.p1  ORF type:complete len:429 (+),score=60.40 GILK01006376.1:186-1472(+)